MPWNLFIFPLAAGYLFLTRSYYFKFIQQRLDKQRLIFETILKGSYIGALALIIRFIIEYAWPELIVKVYNQFPFKEHYTLTSIASIPIALLMISLNLFLDKQKYVIQAISKVGNEFELKLKEAFINENLILISLKNNKFYIGWVIKLPLPGISEYIRIIPAISGFRDKTLQLNFTTHYLSIYADYVETGNVSNINQLNTDLIIKMSEILSVSFFDLEMYEKFKINDNGQ